MEMLQNEKERIFEYCKRFQNNKLIRTLSEITSEKFDHNYRPCGREFIAGREQVTQ